MATARTVRIPASAVATIERDLRREAQRDAQRDAQRETVKRMWSAPKIVTRAAADSADDVDESAGDADDAAPVAITPLAIGDRERERERAQQYAETRLDEALAVAAQSADPVAWLVAHATAYPLLSATEERELAVRMRTGADAEARQARERLILCNLRLVMVMAVRYQGAARGVELADLTQEGIIGLMHAIEKFEPGMAYKLSTYATWWIAQSMYRAAARQGHAIRLPQYAFDRRRRAMRIRAQLSVTLGCEPTLEQWSQEAEISVEDLCLLQLWAQPVTSLEKRLRTDAHSDNDARTLGDLMADPQAEADIEAVERGDESAAWIIDLARYALRHDPRCEMRLDVFVRHGRDGVPLATLGTRYGVTREAIRQQFERTCGMVAAAIVEAREGDGASIVGIDNLATMLAALAATPEKTSQRHGRGAPSKAKAKPAKAKPAKVKTPTKAKSKRVR